MTVDRPQLTLSPAIVIPFYHGGAYIAQTLDSLRAQTIEDWTAVIAVDGATADEQAQLEAEAAADGRISLVVTPGRTGPAAARNRGAEACPPERTAILFLDCDDVLRPDALARLAMALADERYVAAHGLATYLGDHLAAHRPGDITAYGRSRQRVTLDGDLVPVRVDEPTTFEALVLSNWISTPGQALVRRSAYDAVGGFSETVPRAIEDWDLWLRLAARGPIAHVDEVVLDWRQHEGSLSDDGKVMASKEDDYRLSLALDPSLTPDQATLVDRGRTAELRRRRNDKARYGALALRKGNPVLGTRNFLRAARVEWTLHGRRALHRRAARDGGDTSPSK